MAPRNNPHSIINKLIDVFDTWLKHRQEMREIRDLDSTVFANIAHELSITPADLDTLVRQGPRAVDELPKLLAALGIDEEALSRAQPFVLRDMARVCASCQQKHRCDCDLDAGTSAQNYDTYCPNASTIHALERTRTDLDVTNTVKMSQRLTAAVDAWAEAHDRDRSDAIRQLVEFGLSCTRSVDPLRGNPRNPTEIKNRAVEQITPLLDPSLPIAERERRIRRLTEGPPEFLDERLDLPQREWADRCLRRR
jgi:hypothetical protein